MHSLGSMWQGLLTVRQIGCRKWLRTLQKHTPGDFFASQVPPPKGSSLTKKCHQPGEQCSEWEAMGDIFDANHNFSPVYILISMPSPNSDPSQLIKEGWINSGHRLILQQRDLAPLAVPAHTDAPRPVINQSCPFPSPAIARPNPVPLNPWPSWLLNFSFRVWSCSPADWSPWAVPDICKTSFLAFFFLSLPFNCRLWQKGCRDRVSIWEAGRWVSCIWQICHGLTLLGTWTCDPRVNCGWMIYIVYMHEIIKEWIIARYGGTCP